MRIIIPAESMIAMSVSPSHRSPRPFAPLALREGGINSRPQAGKLGRGGRVSCRVRSARRAAARRRVLRALPPRADAGPIP